MLSKVMETLYEEKALNFKDVYLTEKRQFTPEDTDAPTVEDYFRLIANFLTLLSLNHPIE